MRIDNNMLTIKKLVFRFIFRIVYFAVYFSIDLKFRLNKQKHFVQRNTIVSIIKRLLDVEKRVVADNIYRKNLAYAHSYLVVYKLYLFLLSKHLHKNTQIKNIHNKIDFEKGTIFLTFHFIGNIENLVRWISLNNNELHIIYGKNFFTKDAERLLGKKKDDTFENLKYIHQYNKLFKLKLISFDEPNIFYELSNILKSGGKVLFMFDEFPKTTKNETHFFKYRINDYFAARVPKTIFYLLKKTNCQLVPIINVRENIINNSVHILGNINYNYALPNVSFEVESERVLKIVYDFFVSHLRETPELLMPSVWLRFYYYVKSSSNIRNNTITTLIDSNKSYKPEGDFICYLNRRKNFGYIFRENDLKCAKVSAISVKIFSELIRKNHISKNELMIYRDEINAMLSNFAKEGFISELK
ncbi:MAG: hypothetical protein HOO91_01610 [Bacteroidales bacterium]|nr:hypothetical protein [Bacteroidales bacterium]